MALKSFLGKTALSKEQHLENEIRAVFGLEGKASEEKTTLEDIQNVLKAAGSESRPEDIPHIPFSGKTHVRTPLSQPAFMEFLKESTDSAAVMEQLEAIRSRCKQERGFLKKNFNVFASKDPLDAIVDSAASFEQFCRDNDITFDDEAKALALAEKESLAEKLWEWRFLIAAAGGALTGAAGIDIMSHSPELAAYPGVFFSKILPGFVVPFTALSLFKTASRDDAAKDALLFARFGVTMTLGAALSIAIINAEEHFGLIDTHNPPVIAAATQSMADQIPGAAEAAAAQAVQNPSLLASALDGLNPSAYMLDGVGLGLGLGVAYGLTRRRRARGEGDPSSAWDRATGLVASAADKPGQALIGVSNFMDGQFNNVVTYGGIPAIYLLLGHTIAEHGVGEFSHYAGLYATAFGSMGLATALVGAGLYASGVRSKEEWKAVSNVAHTAFSTSSGAATIDTIKESLKTLGVSEKTRDLTPIATAFHMFGPTVCLGSIALYANGYFGHEQTVLEQAQTLGIVIASMLAVRGVPTANGALLTPVLNKDGLLTPAQINTVNAAVIGPDRLLDMCETVVNTVADVLVLKWHDESNWAQNIAKVKGALWSGIISGAEKAGVTLKKPEEQKKEPPQTKANDNHRPPAPPAAM